jgi:acyl carrier protein
MNLKIQVAQIIIEMMEFEEFTPENFPYQVPLFASAEDGGLGMDSIASLEIVMRLAEVFSLDFDDMDREDFESVETLVAHIERKLAESRAE